MKKLLLILFLFASSLLYSKNIYVSTTGNNGNSGLTELLAKLTIAGGQSIAVPGDSVIVLNGTYTTTSGQFAYLTAANSGTSGSPITYKAKNKGLAIIDGNLTTDYGIFCYGVSYINIEGFKFFETKLMCVPITNGANHINVIDCEFDRNGKVCTETTYGLDAIYINQSSYLTIERNLFHDIGRLGPSEGGCTPSSVYWMGHDHGIYCEGGNYVYIQNNVFYNMQRGFSCQVYSGGGYTTSNFYFINNTCENGNYNQTVQGHLVLYGTMVNAVIANNVFKDQYSSAIAVSQVSYTYTNILITKNLCYGGNAVWTNATGLTITNNYDNTNPLFVDEANHNYALQSTSPAINVGYNTGLTTDYLGNARTGTIDLGAYEYQSGTTTYYNTIQSGTATRNDCQVGYYGSTVAYNVSANTYNSTASQIAADNLAIADVSANKQAYANANGTCTVVYSGHGTIVNRNNVPLTRNNKAITK